MQRKWILFLPLLLAQVLALVLFSAIGKDPTKLETARLNDPVPAFALPDLKTPGVMRTQAELKGEIRLLNVWATWCPTCRAEHAYLNILARQGVRIVGLNYKDDQGAALKWLNELGDPYEFNVFDPEGKLGFDLGVYGAPETYVIDRQGVVRYRHVGDVNDKVWQGTLQPLLQTLAQEP